MPCRPVVESIYQNRTTIMVNVILFIKVPIYVLQFLSRKNVRNWNIHYIIIGKIRKM